MKIVRKTGFLWCAAIGAMVVGGAAGLSHAGVGGGVGAGAGSREVRPPAPSDPGKPSAILYYGVALVAGGIAYAIAIMPSKRTHQD